MGMNLVESCSSCGGLLTPEVDGTAVCVTCALALALEPSLDGELAMSSDQAKLLDQGSEAVRPKAQGS
jgi:hypothetical protein